MCPGNPTDVRIAIVVRMCVRTVKWCDAVIQWAEVSFMLWLMLEQEGPPGQCLCLHKCFRRYCNDSEHIRLLSISELFGLQRSGLFVSAAPLSDLLNSPNRDTWGSSAFLCVPLCL